MQPILTCDQLKCLGDVLRRAFSLQQHDDANLLALFLTAKEIEGCSPRAISYYESAIKHMVDSVAKPYTQIASDDLRKYLCNYETTRKTGKATIDNIRRIPSSFFAWLEDEDYIVKSPVRRIHRVKTATVTKEVLSDEDLEVLRDGCTTIRDLALVDMFTATGMRIGELVGLDKTDVDLTEREGIVTGKGNKQRPVYFDARAKLHLQAHLESRQDDSPALFVALDASATRLSIGGIETRLRAIGKSCGLSRVYPHIFRRTLATQAIDKECQLSKCKTPRSFILIQQSSRIVGCFRDRNNDSSRYTPRIVRTLISQLHDARAEVQAAATPVCQGHEGLPRSPR